VQTSAVRGCRVDSATDSHGSILGFLDQIILHINNQKIRGPSPRANRRLSAKLVPTSADRGCHVVNVTDLYDRILGFLDRSRYFFFQVAPQLYSGGWVDPIPDPLLLRKSGCAGNWTRDLWICSQELWPNNCEILYLFDASSNHRVTALAIKTGRSVNTYHLSKELIFTAKSKIITSRFVNFWGVRIIEIYCILASRDLKVSFFLIPAFVGQRFSKPFCFKAWERSAVCGNRSLC
jgi:hypothetical protein